MKQEHLFPMVRSKLQELLAGYVQHPSLHAGIDEYVVPPGLGDNAGLCGSLALAKLALSK